MTLVRVRIDTLWQPALGPVRRCRPDALAALIRVLDSLRAEDGSTTVDGLDATARWDGLEYAEEQYRYRRQGAGRRQS